MIYPKTSDITWHSGKESLKKYKFGSNKLVHHFCPECGTSIFGLTDTPGFFEGMAALNVSLLCFCHLVFPGEWVEAWLEGGRLGNDLQQPADYYGQKD